MLERMSVHARGSLRASAWPWLLSALLFGCHSSASKARPASSASAAAAGALVASDAPLASAAPTSAASLASAEASSSAQPMLDPKQGSTIAELAPARLIPALPALEQGMMDHATELGWSRDSKEFAYCRRAGGGGIDGMACDFIGVDGKHDKMIDFDPGTYEPDAAKRRALAARMKARGYAPGVGRWRFPELSLFWTVSDGWPAQNRAGLLKIGARVDGAKVPTLVSSLRGRDAEEHLHAEAIALSPNGEQLAVLVHGYEGEFSDRFEAQLLSVALIAGRAYNDAGMALHASGHYLEAAALFRKAAAADPSAKLPSYNLACALARAGDPAVEGALRLALSRDPEEVKRKAAADADFASVSEQPWFDALIR
jgi:hypothetical protein